MAYLALVFAALALAPHGYAANVSPVNKVLQMMSEMKTKGAALMAEEAKTYAAYSEWVVDQERKLTFEIETGHKDTEMLLAEALLSDNDVDKLRSSVTALENEMASTQKEKSDATALRNKLHAEYVKLSEDYSESIDALNRALQTMQSTNYDVPQAMALMQRMSASTPGMRGVLAAMLEEKEDQTTRGGFLQETAKGAPSAAAYEFQSGGIVQVLEKLSKKFENELHEVESQETNQVNNYQMEMLHLDDALRTLKKDLEEKSVKRTKRATDSASAKGDLATAKDDIAEDEQTLRDMKATFAAKTETFKANQATRKQELETISEAVAIFSNPSQIRAGMDAATSVSVSHSKHFGLLQKPWTSFLQLQSGVEARVSAQNRAILFLKKKAQLLSSEVLRDMAAQAVTSPFDKVINMIKALLTKLKESAESEADRRSWCEKEAKSNELKQDKKSSSVNQLAATHDLLTQTIASISKRIATLSQEQADLQSAISEATTQRQAEKATNLETIKDATEGADVTKQALVLLKEFYSAQSSLLQEGSRQEPAMAAYKGMVSTNGGVMGMLQTISSDFSRLKADTTVAESSAARDYDSFMKDAKGSKKFKYFRERDAKREKDQKEWELRKTAQELQATQEELDKAMDYKHELKSACVEVRVSYEERVMRRKEEIEALKEAYKILDQK